MRKIVTRLFTGLFTGLFRSSCTRSLVAIKIVALVSLLTACSSKGSQELQWARNALERNPQLKVLSVDTDQNSIKLRITATGEVVSVTPGELAAIPIADLVALSQLSQQKATMPNEPISEPISKSINESITESIPAQSNTAAVTEETTTAPALSEPTPATNAIDPSTYKVQREDGRVKVSGPGVSIESAPQDDKNNPRGEKQTLTEPIICDNRRFTHLDGKTLNISGDAIIARGGCQLHITNSTINATGTGVTVLDATVHITNSTIHGSEGSLTTSSAAHVFLSNNKFTGLARRHPQAEIRELAGNTWR